MTLKRLRHHFSNDKPVECDILFPHLEQKLRSLPAIEKSQDGQETFCLIIFLLSSCFLYLRA